MRTFSFCSQKGGATKTAITAHLGVYAASCGERTVIIDIDPQETAKDFHRRRGEGSETPTVVAAIKERIPTLQAAAKEMGITLMLIDTAPAIDAGALAAMRAADLIVVPSRADSVDMDALKSTVSLISRLGKLDRAVCVINCAANEKAYGEARKRAEAHGLKVLDQYISYRQAFPRALAEGKGITEYTPKDLKAIAELHAVWHALNKLCPLVVEAPKKVEAHDV